MSNERKTEQLFREILRRNNFYNNQKIIVEEQQSDNPKIDKLLKNASKKGNGKGYPEFIIRHDDYPNLIIVVECKAELKHHKSETLTRYSEFAVDGSLLYGSFLNREFDVICIGFSGQEEKKSILDTYYYPHSSLTYSLLKNPTNDIDIKELLDFEKYESIIHYNPEKEKIELEKIMKFADKLHNYMRDNIGLTEEQKPLIVSAIMLALQDKAFMLSYKEYSEKRIGEEVIRALKSVLENSGIPESKIINLTHTFAFIQSHEGLKSKNINNENNFQYCIREIDECLSPFMKKYIEHDIVGKFYGEFISYTGGDGKGLGVVLTPKHITEFMAELIQIDENSVVLDSCTGTGAFLITAMHKMIKSANSKFEIKEERESKIDAIKKKQLIGVEKLPNMYAMVCANMIFRGDGKSNILNGSCFDFKDNIKALKPTHALINPPYSQKGEGLQEIDFIQYTLDCLEIGGRLAAIVPMNVAIDIKSGRLNKRNQLLKLHRLDAVLSMNDQLFQPYANTCTCIIIFTAHIPHQINEYHQTFFGYFKDDGYRLTRKGRIDKDNKWQIIKQEWLNYYFNKKNIAGLTINKKVFYNDEWCAEAYIETDYSTLTEADFIKTIKDYAGFKLINSDLFNGDI